ncbi:mating factor alpha precursor, partial [Scheffersomyces stipitis CBS 6054]
MHLRSTAILSAVVFTSVALSAPTSGQNIDIDFPDESIAGAIPLSYDLVPIIGSYQGQNVILIVNSTIAAASEAAASEGKSKRDANAWHWTSYGVFEPGKRDANANAAPWHWTSYGVFEPGKRDANADAAPWHWTSYGVFEPGK